MMWVRRTPHSRTCCEEGATVRLRRGCCWPRARGNGRRDPHRRHFRHEVGSALAVMGHAGDLTDRVRDLAAYLAASHHGKVRLGIRSLPGRRRGSLDSTPEPGHLLGYPVDEDEMETLPCVDLGDGAYAGETELDMSIAQIGISEAGERSWLDRTLGLLEWLGPFKARLPGGHGARRGHARQQGGAGGCTMTGLHTVELRGCTPEPLMAYLKALGVFRLVAEQADPDARAFWRNGHIPRALHTRPRRAPGISSREVPSHANRIAVERQQQHYPQRANTAALRRYWPWSCPGSSSGLTLCR